ncbi:MAG TPA: hypothetical protein DC049_14870, partial [Spirochaetia bacterium]|nr:hypothetical protein [Spirochaetia bacterium]
GGSSEFREHENYTAGDSLRHINWRIYAKSGKLFLKTRDDEQNPVSAILFDVSSSMRSRYNYAGKIPALENLCRYFCYAFIIHRQPAAFSFFSTRLHEPLAAEKIISPQKILQKMHEYICGADRQITDYCRVFSEAIAAIPQNSRLYLVSDFYIDPEKLAKELAKFTLKKCLLTCVHFIDSSEYTLNIKSGNVFIDSESGEKMYFDGVLSAEYRRLVDRHIKNMELACRAAGINYKTFFTAQNPLRQFAGIFS